MQEQGSSVLDRWIGIADVHRDSYRTFCVLAGVLNPAFGMVYQLTNPSIIDPLWARFMLGVVSLLLLSLSYMSEWVKSHFVQLVRVYFYSLICFYVGLTALNRFAPDYVMGMMFVITAIGIVFGLGLTHTRPLVVYLCFCVVLVAPALAMIPGQINPAIVMFCVVSISTVIYIATRAKIHAEEAVRSSELRYRTLMNGANDAIFIIDPEANEILDANDKAQELTGKSTEELRRLKPTDLLPPDHGEDSLALLYTHAVEGASFAADFSILSKGGVRKSVDVSASLIDVGGRRLVQAIMRDATERYRYEKKLIEAKEHAEEMLRLKTSFLNNMTHEIRTPLTGILGFAEVLSAEVEAEQQEFVKLIRESAKRLHQTLNSVLDLAQLESGKSSLALDYVDLDQEAREVVAMLQPLAQQKGLTLRAVVRTPGVFAELDEGCLRRVLNNLVGNAIKFTDEGYVSIEVDANDRHVFLRVRDTGIGISEEFQRHLFGEFRQESTGISRSYEGNGLGLAITKRLVDLMQGSIDVESIKGLGSTFTVSFPRAYRTRAAIDTTVQLGDPAAQGDRSILVVEDNPATRYLITYCLNDHYHVELAATPEQAMEHALRQRFDLLVLDINLTSARDGVDLLHDLRGLAGYEGIPAIALTAYSLPGERERFLGQGFDLYLSKPFELQDLLQTVERAALLRSGDGSVAPLEARHPRAAVPQLS